jgi:hypothetical protein
MTWKRPLALPAVLALAALALGAIAPRQATAQSALPGTSLYATGDEIWVRFVSYDAAYTNDLYFFAYVGQSTTTAQYLFTNKTAVPGSEVQVLGGYTANQEITFGIYVYDQARGRYYTYYSGAPSNNPDGVQHVQLWKIADGRYGIRVGFEDLYGGGDKDYNDLIFEVSGVTHLVTPEPVTIVLLGSGLIGLGGAGFVRRRRGHSAATTA